MVLTASYLGTRLGTGAPGPFRLRLDAQCSSAIRTELETNRTRFPSWSPGSSPLPSAAPPARPGAARSGLSHRSRSTPIVSNNARVSSLPNMSQCEGANACLWRRAVPSRPRFPRIPGRRRRGRDARSAVNAGVSRTGDRSGPGALALRTGRLAQTTGSGAPRPRHGRGSKHVDRPTASQGAPEGRRACSGRRPGRASSQSFLADGGSFRTGSPLLVRGRAADGRVASGEMTASP
jgi:hypothetical protein